MIVTSQQLAKNLREIAALYEAHPELPAPQGTQLLQCWVSDDCSKEHMAQIARIPGGWDKKMDSDEYATFRLERKMGNFIIMVKAWRKNVCERVQVSTIHEPERVIPAREAAVIPARDVPVYEWHCPDSLLSEAEEETVSA
jgi:hypothetical protein